MRKRQKLSYLILGMFFLSIWISFIPIVKSQDSSEKEFEGTLTKDDDNDDVMTDSQWQWYKFIVDVGESVEVNVSYSGDLDLDVRLYWKRDNNPLFNGFDLSHCDASSSDYVYADNSQFRTNDTYALGYPEEVFFKNFQYLNPADKEAFVLIYVFSGTGESDYKIVSNHVMEELNDDVVFDCNLGFVMILVYGGIGVIIAAISSILVYRKRNKLVRQTEEKEKFDKKEQKELETIDLDSKMSDVKTKKKE